mgnify:CR=1 FL=1
MSVRYTYTAGAANSRLSKRSSTPPCPGISRPRILYLADSFQYRFYQVARGAATATMMPIAKAWMRENWKISEKTRAVTTVPIKPPKAPSCVLPG